jgi:hypothetical protein
MRKARIVIFAVVGIGSVPSFAQTVTIDHRPIGCAVAEKFPRLEARFSPAETVATAHIVFQPEKSEHWWSVAMKAEGESYVGVLPKPEKSLKAFQYYLEVTGKALGTARTPEYAAAVVPSSGACQGKLMSVALSSASVLLQGPAGIAGIPGGFASAGVIAGSSSAGAAGAGAAAAGGGGVGAGVILAGVGVVAAGAAVAVLPKNDESSNDSGTGGGPPPQYDVTFVGTQINISACGAPSGSGGPTGFAGITPDASGAFNELHTQITPVVRVTGRITATTFEAQLSCVNGAQTGSMSATGSNFTLTGTFVFGSQSGGIRVTRR